MIGATLYNNGQGGTYTEGIHIRDDAGTPSLYNTVALNRIYDDQGAPTQTYGIREQDSSNYSHIQDNIITNMTAPVATVGANTNVGQNIGYVTENSGASTGTGAQQTVAHGLGFTPTAQQVALTPGSATALPFHSAAPDATNIYVTATLNQAWYWATVGQ